MPLCVLQVNGVKEVADYVSKLRRVGKGLGVYQFDAVSQPLKLAALETHSLKCKRVVHELKKIFAIAALPSLPHNMSCYVARKNMLCGYERISSLISSAAELSWDLQELAAKVAGTANPPEVPAPAA